MSWSLYELSRHQAVQASLREEVLSVLGGRKVPTAADVAQMPLLKATIKEVLRWDSKGFPPCLEKHLLYLFQKGANSCFLGCTPLFLPTPGWSQRETFKSEATSSQKMWVCPRENVHRHAALIWLRVLTLCWLHADSDHPLPLCNITGSGCVSTPGWIPAPALVEQGAEPPSVCLRTLWGGEAQLHRSTYRWAGALPRCCQGEFGMQGNCFGPIRLLTLLDKRKRQKSQNLWSCGLYY